MIEEGESLLLNKGYSEILTRPVSGQTQYVHLARSFVQASEGAKMDALFGNQPTEAQRALMRAELSMVNDESRYYSTSLVGSLDTLALASMLKFLRVGTDGDQRRLREANLYLMHNEGISKTDTDGGYGLILRPPSYAIHVAVDSRYYSEIKRRSPESLSDIRQIGMANWGRLEDPETLLMVDEEGAPSPNLVILKGDQETKVEGVFHGEGIANEKLAALLRQEVASHLKIEVPVVEITAGLKFFHKK